MALLIHIFFFQWLQPLQAAVAVALLVWLVVAGRTVQVVGPLLRRNPDRAGPRDEVLGRCR